MHININQKDLIVVVYLEGLGVDGKAMLSLDMPDLIPTARCRRVKLSKPLFYHG
jgi:hypothetical protein